MSQNSREELGGEDDYDAYDGGTLFEEYVERAEENFQDPELEVIQTILEKKRFKIKAEHLNHEVLIDPLTGSRTMKVAANFALVDAESDEPVIVLLQRVLSAPVLDTTPTHKDHGFLKSESILW